MMDTKKPPENDETRAKGGVDDGSGGPPEPCPPEPEGPASDTATLVHEIEVEHEELRTLRNRLKKKEGEARQLKKDNEDLRDQLLRRLADMDNLKKRLEREKTDFYQYALSEFVKELLPVLDNLERALEHPDEGNGKSLQEGVRLIHKQFLDALRKRGVAPILDIIDRKFDPAHEQALATEESDAVEEPVVAAELQRGYTLNDRLLRPALVRVRMPKKAQG